MAGRSSPCDGDGDDFTRITGIGKALDRRLHQAGVNSYADLAALNPEEIASRLSGPVAVRPGRIGHEDWSGQAARLADEATGAGTDAAAGEAGEAEDVLSATPGVSASSPKPPAGDATGLYYQSFVVRILLHESDGRIASTTVQHVGSGAERRWPGLDKPAMLDFISAYLSPGSAAALPARPAGGPGEAGRPGVPAPSPPGDQAGQPQDEPVARPADVASHGPAGEPDPLLPASSSTPGQVSLTMVRDLRVPHPGEPFTVAVTLDLTDVEPPAASRVGFSAVVLARPLGGAAPQVVSQSKGIIPAGAPVITLHSSGLPAGTYRLEAVVELIESHGRTRDLVASMEGGILVVSGPGAKPALGRQLQRIP
jgi:hypothetical protein